MALAPRTILGPHEVLEPSGARRMAEVYRARDTRPDRTVAINILPEHLSPYTESKQRFEREARAVSGLNHPLICTLHDMGRKHGLHFLVVELIELLVAAQPFRRS